MENIWMPFIIVQGRQMQTVDVRFRHTIDAGLFEDTKS